MIVDNKKQKKSIDFASYFVILFFSLIYFVNSFIYANVCFPNCYAWKDLMIKWTDGELIRRGLLGYIFYLCDDILSIKYFATFLFYVFFMVPIIVLYKRLRFLDLPLWLLVTILLSPSFFLFNLHESLVYKKDIILIFGTTITLVIFENIFNKQNITLKVKFASVSLLYILLYTIFLLIFETYVFFIPLILLYIYANFLRLSDAKISLFFTLILTAISFILATVLIIPNIGDVNSVKKFFYDWHLIYPDLVIYLDALYEFDGPPDPWTFILMSKKRYFECFEHIWQITKLYELILIYVLQFVPILLTFQFINRKDVFCNVKYLSFCALFAIHCPLLLSFIAFDFGRWIIFTFYLSVIYISFFMKGLNSKHRENKYYKNSYNFLAWIISIIYISTWTPYHYPVNEHFIGLDSFLIREIYKVFQFFYVNGDLFF